MASLTKKTQMRRDKRDAKKSEARIKRITKEQRKADKKPGAIPVC